MNQKPKMKVIAEEFKQTAPDRLELKKGGGCIGCFGFPFFCAGIFMLLISLHIVPLSNANEVPWWTYLVMLGMGLIFTGVGSALVFGRQWIDIDKTQRRIWVAWGLLRPMKGQIYNLDDYKTVLLKFVAGDHDTSDSYPVVLRTEEGGRELSMCSSVNYGDSRKQADLLMSFLQIPLEDITTDHADKIVPATASTERIESPEQAEPETALPPYAPKCDVQTSEDSVLIRIPGQAFSKLNFIGLIIPLGIMLYFIMPVLTFFDQTKTPPYVQYFFTGFFVLMFVIIPISGFIKRYSLSRKFTMAVTAGKQGIVLQYLRFGGWKTITLPLERIVDIDYSTSETVMNAAWKGSATTTGTFTQNRPASYTLGEKPRWIALMERLARSKGVIIKSMDGMYYFGAGLPSDEVYYLYCLTRKYLYPKQESV